MAAAAAGQAQLGMGVDAFVEKWRRVSAGETQAAQSHFNDLCDVIGVPKPLDADPEGVEYAFEKGVKRPDGSTGQADVRKAGCFGWEYKGKRKNLSAAYEQLLGYREGLGNPPLLVVCDMNRFEIHTNFTNTEPRVIEFTLKHLEENPAHYIRLLREVFLDPEALHPNNDPRYITETAAAKFGEVAEALRERDGHDPALVARFLNRIIFCFFAESVGLYRNLRGVVEKPVTDVFDNMAADAMLSKRIVGQLFEAMAERDVRNFGAYYIRWFNGGLFDETAVPETLQLTGDLAQIINETAELNWSRVDPAIFGTLFERGLDPKRRSQLGAHYTDPDNIMRVVEPVALRPLRREFDALRAELAPEHRLEDAPPPGYGENSALAFEAPDPDSPAGRIQAFHERLAAVRVLDPACGSGNFLYVAMRELKNLEQELIEWAQGLGVNGLQRRIGPHNMLGIDIDPFAADLTRMSLWIGHIQWNIERNIDTTRDPVLGRADQIECRDAILAEDEAGNPVPAEWPEAEFVVGNPPFLGSKKMRMELGDDYVDRLRLGWSDSISGLADLCVYWHEQARRHISDNPSRRAGLLATQAIRAEFSRPVLERVVESGAISFAWSDEPWTNEGANVRISIVGQDAGRDADITLNGQKVSHINPDLTTGLYLAGACELPENKARAFQGIITKGPFEISPDEADRMLGSPVNVNGRPNSDVIFPFFTATDVAQRPRDRYVIYFGSKVSQKSAARYEEPFEHVKREVAQAHTTNKHGAVPTQWWLHHRDRPAMRAAIAPLARYIATPELSKHRFFVWLPTDAISDHTLVVIATDDDSAFGLAHSRAHEVWAIELGARLGLGPRYRVGGVFNTFPFPWPLNTADDALAEAQIDHRDAIAAAAVSLNEQREAWLNPPNADPDELRQRTMTNLYNDPPVWLQIAHQEIDEAVFAAYGWPADLSDDEVLARLLALNLERAGG